MAEMVKEFDPSKILEWAKKEFPMVTIDEGIMCGAPCVKGTRIPVYMVLDTLLEHGTLEGVLKDYPRLTIEQVKGAVSFARAILTNPRPYY